MFLANGGLDPLFESALAKAKLREQAMRYLVEVASGRTSAFAAPAKFCAAIRRISRTLGLSRDPAASAFDRSLRMIRA